MRGTVSSSSPHPTLDLNSRSQPCDQQLTVRHFRVSHRLCSCLITARLDVMREDATSKCASLYNWRYRTQCTCFSGYCPRYPGTRQRDDLNELALRDVSWLGEKSYQDPAISIRHALSRTTSQHGARRNADVRFSMPRLHWPLGSNTDGSIPLSFGR